MANEGKVIQIIGPVVDVEFEESLLPPIYQALNIVSDGFDVPEPMKSQLNPTTFRRRKDADA